MPDGQPASPAPVPQGLRIAQFLAWISAVLLILTAISIALPALAGALSKPFLAIVLGVVYATVGGLLGFGAMSLRSARRSGGYLLIVVCGLLAILQVTSGLVIGIFQALINGTIVVLTVTNLKHLRKVVGA